MKIHFNCPNCDFAYTAKQNQAGLKGKCRKCGLLMTVPNQSNEKARPQVTKIEPKNKKLARIGSIKTQGKVVISFILLACLTIIGFLGWQWYTNRPEYTVSQIRSAIDSSSRLKFEKYVDVDRFSKDLVDELLEGAIRASILVDNAGWSMLDFLIGRNMIEAVKPTLEASIKSSIIKAIDAGDIMLLWEGIDSDSADLQFTPEHLAKKSGLTAEKKYKLGELEREGERAYLPLNIYDDELDTTFTIRIDIRREKNIWRVVGIEGLGELIINKANLHKNKSLLSK